LPSSGSASASIPARGPARAIRRRHRHRARLLRSDGAVGVVGQEPIGVAQRQPMADACPLPRPLGS
jgi:hypothetical protein